VSGSKDLVTTKTKSIPRTMTIEGHRLSLSADSSVLTVTLSKRAAEATGNDGWASDDDKRGLWRTMRKALASFVAAHGLVRADVISPVQTMAGVQQQNVATIFSEVAR
jgi:hypothetical protein